MKEFIKAARLDELKPGEMKLVEAENERVLLANIDGRFYAIGEVCTHAEGPLSEGMLEGPEVECPYHGSRFDVTTGKVIQGPAEDPEPRYTVRVEGQDILVGPG